jgi:hypothetical protein
VIPPALRRLSTWSAIAAVLAALGLALSPELRAALGQLLVALGVVTDMPTR